MNDMSLYIYIQNHTFRLILSIIWVFVVDMFAKRKEKKEENETTYTIYANFCL